MKLRLILFATAMSLMAMACNVKTGQDGDATAKADSLMNEEAVVSRVESVYKYLNDVWQYYLETPPEKIENNKWQPVDNHFATREWRQVRQEVDSIDRLNDCNWFFDFDGKGPLDPWQYYGFEGKLTVEDIKATLLDDGTAQADFKIKDATSIESIPLRWQLCIEDGEWRVANVFFVKDNNLDLLKAMKEHIVDIQSKLSDGIPSNMIAPESEWTEDVVKKAVMKYIEQEYDTRWYAHIALETIKVELLTCNIAKATAEMLNTETDERYDDEIYLDYEDGEWKVRQ